MKTLTKFTIPIILLILTGCAHHSGYYSAYSGSSDYEYGLGVSSYNLRSSYPVYYDRHIYIDRPIVHEYYPYSSDHVYPDRHYNKHQKPYVNKLFPNSKYPHKTGNYSINKYQKHQKPKVNNYFSTNKHSIKSGSHAIKNYSTQRNQLKHQKQAVKNYPPNNKHSNKGRNFSNNNYSTHKNQQRYQKQTANKYSNKAKNHSNRQYTTNNQSFSSGVRYNRHSKDSSSRKMISGKNYKR